MQDFALRTPWVAWPAADAPDLRLALSLRDECDALALLGDRRAGARGRYGVVGLPQAVQDASIGQGTLQKLAQTRPTNALRVVLLGYEFGLPLVHLPQMPAPANQPHAIAADLKAYLVVDHITHTMAWGGPDDAALQRLQRQLVAPRPLAGTCKRLVAPRVVFEPHVTDAEHAQRLRCVLDAIAAGDIYQANLTRQLHARGGIDGLDALAKLARHNPVAHAAWVRFGNVELVSSTMETLLHYDARTRVAESFPIKGTCARTRSAAALRADTKEQAEHVMIVDLVRNDLGKLAEPGSVDVPALMTIEPYRGIWHGVSTIRAQLKREHNAGSALEALFPGGSIVGAPKRRAMQILQSIEKTPRGFYTGSLGVIAPNGDAHFSILIRTLVHDSHGWHLGVGGGIVADSHAERELTEMNEKVAVFRDLLAGEPSGSNASFAPVRAAF